MTRSEYDAHEGLQRATPAWQQPSRCVRPATAGRRRMWLPLAVALVGAVILIIFGA